MRTFTEKEQCEGAAGRKLETCVVQHDLPCRADSCISRRFHRFKQSQLGWHDKRALERTGLVEEFEKEMGDE